MRAIELREFGGPLTAIERPPLPTNSEGTVIEVTACGVCHSDIHVVDGQFGSPLPLVPGHEVTGIDKKLGPVMVYAPWGCRACWLCETGHEMICPDGAEAGIVVDGGYAEQMHIPHREYLHPLGDLDPVASAPLACGGLTAFNATRKALGALSQKGSRARALVIGAGGLGQFGIQFLRLMSDAEIWVVDQSTEKLDRALELGADGAAPPEQIDGKYDAVIDFVGATATLESAVERVNRRGSIVAVGLYGGTVPFGVGAVPFEAQLISSVWGTVQELGDLVEFAHHHPLQYTVETMPLAEAEQAHQRLRSGQATGRIVLVP